MVCMSFWDKILGYTWNEKPPEEYMTIYRSDGYISIEFRNERINLFANPMEWFIGYMQPYTLFAKAMHTFCFSDLDGKTDEEIKDIILNKMIEIEQKEEKLYTELVEEYKEKVKISKIKI